MTTKLDYLETEAVNLVAKVTPWCAPLPTAYLVGRATMIHLAWPWPVATCAALIVESLGLATTATTLELYQYNQAKRKSDPGAPFILAALLVLVYFIVATGLTILMDILPDTVRYAPAIFPLLSLTGVTVLALRSDHRRRLESIAQDKAERRAERRARKVSNSVRIYKLDNLDKARLASIAKAGARQNALLEVLASEPQMTISQAAERLGVSRQTVYAYVGKLQDAGRLHKNGNGWEV